jgi:hypothetical protein
MSTVAAGLIAVATGPIAFTATDVDGKPVAATVFFDKGDVIHDEPLVQTLHPNFHHAMSVTEHSEHLCPGDCAKVAAKKAKPPTFQPAAAASAEVK